MKFDILDHYHLFSCTDHSTLTAPAALLPQGTNIENTLNITLEASKPLLLL